MRVQDIDPTLGVFIARELFEGHGAVQSVLHDEVGDWVFFALENPDVLSGEDFVLGHVAHLVADYPVLATVPDLPAGWSATLNGTDWILEEEPPLAD